jgi:predicted Zn-dependent protease
LPGGGRLRKAPAVAALGLAGLVAGCDWIPFSLVSDEQANAMGIEAWQEIVATTPPSRDLRLQKALDEVAARLLAAADEHPADWQAMVFASPDVNAFALPGNRIGVYEGMFGLLERPDQLAAIVGHEIGHVAADHSRERISAEIVRTFGLRVVTLLLRFGEVEFADEIAAALGLGARYGLLLPYSRQHELEADRFGLELMAEAGYDPAAAVELWRNMEAAEGAGLPGFLSTHPSPAERIEALEEMLPEIARRADAGSP